jgi:hypothetical protein
VLTDLRVLSEYCRNPERHEYELYLAVEDIDHSRTETKHPQTIDVIDKSFFASQLRTAHRLPHTSVIPPRRAESIGRT